MMTDLFKGRGVEVGVAWGHNSETILSNPKVSHLTCIDPWDGPGTLENPTFLSCYPIYFEALKYLKQFGSRCDVIRARYQDCLPLFNQQSLDFIYEDGDHSYEAVQWGLNCFTSLLKPGGVYAGHDYCAVCSGVMKAVDEFRRANRHLEFVLTDEDAVADGHSVRSWAFIFPG